MKINSIIKVLICVMVFLSPLLASAQDDLSGGNADVVDAPAAPISDYAPLLLVAGLAIGYRFLRKRSVQ